jgi:hypothetical protein
VETGQHLLALAGHTRPVSAVDYSLNGRWIATASMDGTAGLWDAQTGRQIRSMPLPSQTEDPRAAFDSDSRRLVTVTGDSVQLWEVPSGRLLWTRRPPGNPLVGWLPDGQRLVVCRPEENTVALWDAGTGAELRAWKVSGRRPVGTSVSPDGKRLVTAGVSGMWTGFGAGDLGVWDVETGRLVLDLAGHSEQARARFTKDGRQVVSDSFDGTVRQWEAFPWREEEYAEDGGQGAEGKRRKAAGTFPERVRVYADRYWRERLMAEKRGSERAAQHPVEARLGFKPVWPPRDSRATANQIDLTRHYTKQLNLDFNPNYGWLESDLSELPTGTATLGGVVFDIRGLIQLRRGYSRGMDSDEVSWWSHYPAAVKGIDVGRSFHRLHVLHAASHAWGCTNGATIGSYVLHYVDGRQHACDVVFGQDVRDLWLHPAAVESPTTRGKVVWTGSNPAAKASNAKLRLYLNTWENPRPGVEVARIDYVSALAPAAPFLVAMTIEP